MKILVTGGAGFIGSHTVVALIAAGHQPIIVDSFANSNPAVVNRIKQITGKNVPYYTVDIADKSALAEVFEQHKIESVIHLVGLKAANDSVADPLRYYQINTSNTVALCTVMAAKGVKKILFGSTATVYGASDKPLVESSALDPTSPYARTKVMAEHILEDLCMADSEWQVSILRYFNPIGAHESGLIGEDPRGKPNNLLPYIAQVATGKRKQLSIMGDDYPTPDGTAVRDYLHIMDLAAGHVCALNKLHPGLEVYNFGSGKGSSILEVLHAFEAVSGTRIAYEILPRRPGDVAIFFADPTKAMKELGWKAERSLESMCADIWRWQSQNPNGYDTIN